MFYGKRLVYQRVLHTAIMAPGSRLRATALTWASYVSHCAQITSPARWFPSTWPLLTSCNLVMLHHFITFDLIKLSHFITFYHIWSLYFSNLPPYLVLGATLSKAIFEFWSDDAIAAELAGLAARPSHAFWGSESDTPWASTSKICLIYDHRIS